LRIPPRLALGSVLSKSGLIILLSIFNGSLLLAIDLASKAKKNESEMDSIEMMASNDLKIAWVDR
jgi:hypothetical protein